MDYWHHSSDWLCLSFQNSWIRKASFGLHIRKYSSWKPNILRRSPNERHNEYVRVRKRNLLSLSLAHITDMNNVLLGIFVLCIKINNNFPIRIEIYASITSTQFKVVLLLINSINIISISDMKIELTFQNQYSRKSIHWVFEKLNRGGGPVCFKWY